jgi:hypothetical protein
MIEFETQLISDDGLVATTQAWGHFKEFGETESLLLLYTVDPQALAFPKRDLDPVTAARVRAAVASHVAAGSFRTPPTAFPVVTAALAGNGRTPDLTSSNTGDR